MQQFVVPQFIDVEDKVIGPITVRQFVILLFSAGLEFLAWKYSDLTLFLAETIGIAIFTILFAFIKINGRPVHYFFLNFVQTSKKPWLKIWHKEFNSHDLKASMKKAGDKTHMVIPRKTLVGSTRLTELSLMVDTGGLYEGEENI